MMACSTACLGARPRSPLPRRIISTMLSELVKVRGRAAECGDPPPRKCNAMLSKKERHMDAAELRSRCALGCTRIADSFARRLPERSIKIAPAKAADLSCEPLSGY